MKKTYKAYLQDQLSNLTFTKIGLKFTLYRRDARKGDRANVLSIHEKFFCDALVESGCLPDDSDEYIEYTEYHTAGIDRENPRVEIELIEL